ncbi:uncharacterized protein LOC128254715 [Drosophila gunungcola]|uniref:Uncharacterized protein n=1 Tax=Drosophila gunungcola TaxID=103775 RepID=A0A9Q0BPB2_9MUSC|nr:uncharacterized protein LOC128254715 [Drosophila gunungcola]KAI8038824.1 hypothetical protein M5D96_008733 [Drosophila gunungcola]
MMDIKTFILLAAALVIFASHTFADPVKIDDSEECPPDGNNGGDNNNGGNNHTRDDDSALCPNFQHIRDLIDQVALRELIEVHYNCDKKFRRAMRFYNTSGFVKVTQELTDTAAYQTILTQLQEANVDVADIKTVAQIFYCIILPVKKLDRNCDCKAVKHHSFVNDLLYLMPHQAVHDYIAESQNNQTNFGNFTKAVVSKEFQATLKANVKKSDVVKPLRTLRKNGWDIPELLRAMLTIFQW